MKKKNTRGADTRGAERSGEQDSERVVLKPLFGIQPRVYVAVLYAAVSAGLFFFIFLYPGIFNPGAEVLFTSVPPEASVLVDGLRIGATPLRAFVPQGRHTITVRRPHFEEKKIPLIAGGRIFASRFFPKKEELHAELSLKPDEELLVEAHRDFAAWALSGEPNPLYPVPLVLTAAARDYTLADSSPDRVDKVFRMLTSAAAGVNSPANFRDFVYAALMAASEGRVLSPQSLIQASDWFLSLYGAREEVLYWLILVLPEKAREEFLSSPWTQEQLQKAPAAARERRTPPGRLDLVDGQYAALPAGSFRQGAGFPEGAFSRGSESFSESFIKRLRDAPPYSAGLVNVGAFFLSTREVTQRQYAAFLNGNPAWQPVNRAALIKQGLAEETYLASWGDSPAPPRPSEPVSEISFFAASAYCQWLGSRDGRYTFFLPSETQWEYASLFLPGENRMGLSGGGLWEWCGNWFAPADLVFPGSGDFPAVEKAVRGGAYINTEQGLGIHTRGAQPPQWCSPFTGFRVAAIEKSRGEPWPAWGKINLWKE
ncbi:MAG: SUMF1/EgtB/PvdO family nonheme iron enzyme [Spirochaetales bacterium]|nr:SUMF1/EgtB/PvdO family nonheme iron enzyme [Spirochaetales bacterium]